MSEPDQREKTVAVSGRSWWPLAGAISMPLLALLLPSRPMGSSNLPAQQGPGCPAPDPIVQGSAGPMAHVGFLADDRGE